MYRVTELHSGEKLIYGDTLQEQKSKHMINLSCALLYVEAHRKSPASYCPCKVCYRTTSFSPDALKWALTLMKNCLEVSFSTSLEMTQATSQGPRYVTSCSQPWGCALTCTSLQSEFLALGRNEPAEAIQIYFSGLPYTYVSKLNKAMACSLNLWAWKPCTCVVEFFTFSSKLGGLSPSCLKQSVLCPRLHLRTVTVC